MKFIQSHRTWSNKGFKHTEETKRKMRLSTIKYIENTSGVLRARIGKNEKYLLDKQEKIDNCKILRQYRLNELGYIIDGYCPETNTVYEVYENWHLNRKEKDLHRQKEICNYLNSNFIVIWDK